MTTKRNYSQSQVRKRALFTLNQEIEALESIKDKSLKGLFLASEILRNRKGKIVTCGVGKSAFVAMKISATATSLNHPSIFVHPTDALHGDSGIIDDGDVIIAVSFSGESVELVKLLHHLKKHFKIQIISLTKSKASSLGKISDEVISVNINKEGSLFSLAPMASIIASVALGDMLISSITEQDTNSKYNFAKYHPSGDLGLQLTRVGELMSKGKKIPFVKKTSKLRDVLKVITKKYLGLAGVLDNGKLIGIITDGDVRRHLIATGDIDVMAKDIMTKHPKTIRPDMSLKEALGIMEKYKITNLFVLENNKAVGVIHIHDILSGSALK
jgi:arabinose-5-phosphate isomerase